MRRFVDDLQRAQNEERLPERFTAADVRQACPGWGHDTYTTYLNRHCLGNADGNTVYFMRQGRATFSLLG